MATSTISRRALLGGLALVGWPARSKTEALEGLAAIGARAGIRFGSAVAAASLAEPDLAALLRADCATLTPELEMKWAATERSPDAHDWRGADAIAAWARAEGMRLRGHTLLWHRSVPDWVRLEPGASWAPVARHIRETVARYAADVDEWDVVNEPIAGERLSDGPFLRAFGPSYVRRALEEARAVAPRARLFVNEYDLEEASAEQTGRRATLLALATELCRAGAPLHGVGVQGHLRIGGAALDPMALRDFLAALADLGLAISITELDVKERDYVLPAAERDRLVADEAARFLEVALAHPAVRSLTTWGLSDRQSWLTVDAADRARFPGAWADGSSPGLNRGLPYDAGGAAKPLRGAITEALIQRTNMGLPKR